MSYNIDSVDCLVLDARMKAKDIRKLAKLEDKLPECNFIEEHLEAANNAEHANDLIVLQNFWWYGMGSGWAFDFLKKNVAPLIEGRVEAIFCWEGGDSYSGLTVENGDVTECDVEMKLVPIQRKK